MNINLKAEEEAVKVLDTADAFLAFQEELALALAKGWMDLAAVRYGAGVHSLDHFRACALKASAVTSLDLETEDEAAEPSHVALTFQEGGWAVATVSREGGAGRSSNATPSLEATPFYGPPALKKAAEHFRKALELVAKNVTLQNDLFGAQAQYGKGG